RAVRRLALTVGELRAAGDADEVHDPAPGKKVSRYQSSPPFPCGSGFSRELLISPSFSREARGWSRSHKCPATSHSAVARLHRIEAQQPQPRPGARPMRGSGQEMQPGAGGEAPVALDH